MEFLSKLTPEQLSVLKPEQINAIMGHTGKESDIAVMKHFFDTLSYTMTNREYSYYKTPDCAYDQKKYDEFSNVLLRNSTERFYLTYELVLHNPFFCECACCKQHTYSKYGGTKIENDILTCKNCSRSDSLSYHNPKYYPTNWKLHTEPEILKILPTGIQLESVCLKEPTKEIKKQFFDLPIFFEMRDINRITDTLKIEEFVQVHKNLHIIHPLFLAFAQHFF
jgi:hypothetical protein